LAKGAKEKKQKVRELRSWQNMEGKAVPVKLFTGSTGEYFKEDKDEK